ncbi:MAG: glycine--tRNA ligase subunit beta [Gaiellaceae bacterium]
MCAASRAWSRRATSSKSRKPPLPSLLVEIGCEELPASAVGEAEAQLPDLVDLHLGKRPGRLFVGPRRLAFLLEDVPEHTPDEWVKGPPESRREQAAEGFARKYGVSADELEVRDGFLGVVVPGRPLRELLPERADAIVRGLAFSKSMRWDDSGIRFARPVRWTLAKLDEETVLGETSYGHRFTSGPVEIQNAGDYEQALRAAGVVADAGERRRLIVEGLDAIGGWSDPLGKLAEVIHLVESSHVLEGSFDERYLQLPERLIVTAMQEHQRYFPLGGNRFAFVANGGDPDTVRAGNENVLEARLEDAAFTFERDVAVGVDELAKRLGSITYFADAGTFADKTERLIMLVERLGGGEASREAARLAKADQASELVREFPELEGAIGAEYARLAGYPEAVSKAIEEQYLPDAADAPLPQTEAGKVLAAADKLDTLSVSFGLGHRPSGSRDPYGLRRAAIGLNRLALEGGLTIDRSDLPDEVRDFVEERLESLLDVPVEYVRAARASAVPDLGGVARLAEALYAERDSSAFDGVYTAYDRAHRLAGKAEQEAAPSLDRKLLVEEAERALAEALTKVELDGVGDVRAALESAAELAPYVERFFDEVLVMADDDAVRANRLRLLLDVRDTLGALGDFSQIPR